MVNAWVQTLILIAVRLNLLHRAIVIYTDVDPGAGRRALAQIAALRCSVLTSACIFSQCLSAGIDFGCSEIKFYASCDRDLH